VKKFRLEEIMAAPKKRIVLDPEPQESKTTTLRMPEKLFDMAQKCSQASGLSVNGLICSALADYLSARGYRVHPR